jgi:diguanylate cyclase (GGDEF)-like protein
MPQVLANKEMLLEALNRAATVLLLQNRETFSDVMTEGVGIIADAARVDRMSVSRNFERPDGLYASQIYRWSREADSAVEPLAELKASPYALHIPRWKDVLQSGAHINALAHELPESEALSAFGCLALLSMPVFIEERFWGFVLFENLTEARPFSANEVEALRSASLMVVNTILRHEEASKSREAERRMLGEIEYQNRLLYTVSRVSALLLQSSAESFERDLLRSMGLMAEAAEADRVYIWENYIKDGELYCYQSYEWSGGVEAQQGKELTRDVSYRTVIPRWEEAFRNRNCVNGIVRELPASEREILEQQGILSLLVVPVYLKETLWGFVGFDDCHRERVFSEREESILRSASELIANALIRSSMEKSILQLEAEADKIYYDPLTGIYNRRFFDETMKRVIRTLSRFGGLLSLMMIDIDFFKRYNDTFGHIEGDDCLKSVAQTIRDTLSMPDDFAARYGGEEFVVVLPNTGEEGACEVARRIMENIRNQNIPHSENDAADVVTVSIGVMTGRVEHTHSGSTYVRRADELLYESKNAKRNRYTFGWL